MTKTPTLIERLKNVEKLLTTLVSYAKGHGLDYSVPAYQAEQALTAARAALMPGSGTNKCPYCGYEIKEYTGLVLLNEEEDGYFVMCPNCMADGPEGEDFDDAVNKFNSRYRGIDESKPGCKHPNKVSAKNRAIVDGYYCPDCKCLFSEDMQHKIEIVDEPKPLGGELGK